MSETIKKSAVSKADEFAAVEIRASEVKQQMESAEAVARQLQAGIDARKNKLDALEARVEEALAQQQAVGATTTPQTALS